MENGESFKEIDSKFINFINDLLEQGSNKNVLVIHGLILLSYLETICDFNFDGNIFDIKYKNKVIMNGNPKSPNGYKITYNDNKKLINIVNVRS